MFIVADLVSLNKLNKIVYNYPTTFKFDKDSSNIKGQESAYGINKLRVGVNIFTSSKQALNESLEFCNRS